MTKKNLATMDVSPLVYEPARDRSGSRASNCAIGKAIARKKREENARAALAEKRRAAAIRWREERREKDVFKNLDFGFRVYRVVDGSPRTDEGATERALYRRAYRELENAGMALYYEPGGAFKPPEFAVSPADAPFPAYRKGKDDEKLEWLSPYMRDAVLEFYARVDQYKKDCREWKKNAPKRGATLKEKNEYAKTRPEPPVWRCPTPPRDQVYPRLDLKQDYADEDLLTIAMLRFGFLLSAKFSAGELSTSEGRYWDVYNVEDGALVCCFGSNLTFIAIEEIAKMKPRKFCYVKERQNRDINAVVGMIFEHWSPETVVFGF